MSDKHQFEFFLLRYVPNPDEGVNLGVVLIGSGEDRAFADVRFRRDWRALQCIDPQADIETLQAFEREIRMRLADPADRDIFLKQMQDSFSNLIQLSNTHACLGDVPEKELDNLAKIYLDRATRGGKHLPSGRQRIVAAMHNAFDRAGVWESMMKDIPVEKYTFRGDPLKIDCAYRPNGTIKMFHAVPLATDVNVAKILAFSYPQIVEGINRDEGARALLTAVVEDNLDRSDEAILFALATMDKSQIAVTPVGNMPQIAEVARQEMRL